MKKFLVGVVMFGMAATGCGSAKTSGTILPTPTKPTAVVTTPAPAVAKSAPVTAPPPVVTTPAVIHATPAPIYTPALRATTPAPALTTPVPAATTAPAPPAGATALCNDGTFSYSATHSGTCSHHGGVAVFYQ